MAYVRLMRAFTGKTLETVMQEELPKAEAATTTTTTQRIFVGGLPSDITEQAVKSLFSSIANVESVTVNRKNSDTRA